MIIFIKVYGSYIKLLLYVLLMITTRTQKLTKNFTIVMHLEHSDEEN